MKQILVCMVAITIFIFSAGAQQTRRVKEKKNHYEKGMMKSEINLTPSQKEQLKSQRIEAKNQMMELDKNENLSVKEYKVRKAAIREEQKEKMNNLLTSEQKSQLKKMKSDKKAQHEMKRAKKMEKMQSRLNLSDGQVAQMKATREAQQAQIKMIKENETFSSSEKKEKIMALKNENRDSYKKILTAEQLKKMDEHKKEGNKKRKMVKESSK